MTINKQDIKLFAANIMTDEDNAGGGISSNEILDGSLNAVFVGASRLDKALGRVSIRTAFAAISTENNDTYYACHAILDKPQNDPDVDLMMMKAQSDFETRLEAQTEIQEPIDLSLASPTRWYATGDGSGRSAVFRPKIYIGQSQLDDYYWPMPETFPEFFPGGSIKIGARFYTINFISDGDTDSMYVALTAPLESAVLEGDAVYDSEDRSRWAVDSDVALGELTVSLRHVTYMPGVGDTVVYSGRIREVESIDSTNWKRPVYTFNGPVGHGKGNAINFMPSNPSTSTFYGVTQLSVDALAPQTEITVSETEKFIFPLGSDDVDPDLVGLDSTQLPFNKKVKIFHASSVVVIHSTTEESITNPATQGQTYPLTGTDYQLIELVDQFGIKVNPDLYTADNPLGSVTMAAAIDLSAYTQPLVAQKRYERIKLVKEVDHNTGVVTLAKPIGHTFTAANTYVSSALIFGDIRSRMEYLFDQQTWLNEWSDSVAGSSAGGTFNDLNHPIILTNAGTVSERWAFVFDSDTTFSIIGEKLGHIGTGQTDGAPGTFVAPLNPNTGLPYFKIPQEGWGAGWSVGNTLRGKTVAINQPIRFIRVTQQGDILPELTDNFVVMIRGGIA